MTAVTTKVKCLVQQPRKVAPPPCHLAIGHRLSRREKSGQQRYHLSRPLTLHLTPALLYNSNCAASTKEGWSCSWAALRPNWLRQKWPKIPSDLPRARSHRPESGWARSPSLRHTNFRFYSAPPPPHQAGWPTHCRPTPSAPLLAPHRAPRRVNEARNFGPTLEGCCLCQDGLSFTTHNNGVQMIQS